MLYDLISVGYGILQWETDGILDGMDIAAVIHRNITGACLKTMSMQ